MEGCWLGEFSSWLMGIMGRWVSLVDHSSRQTNKSCRYYEKQGFVRLGDVDDDGWPATVLERRVK